MKNLQQHWNDNWANARLHVNGLARRLRSALGTQHRDILDLGCGIGMDALYLARRGHRIVAMDFSPDPLFALRERAKREYLDLTTLCGDISRPLPFADHSFDVVYAHLSLHYFDDETTRKVFSEVRRVLRNGGLFYVKCKSVDDPLYGKGKKVGNEMFETGHVRHFFRKEYMGEMLKDFHILTLRRSSSTYDGMVSAFVEAMAQKVPVPSGHLQH